MRENTNLMIKLLKNKSDFANYILAKRFCSRCANKHWKKKKKVTVVQTLGLCDICWKPNIVYYRNEILPIQHTPMKTKKKKVVAKKKAVKKAKK